MHVPFRWAVLHECAPRLSSDAELASAITIHMMGESDESILGFHPKLGDWLQSSIVTSCTQYSRD